MRIFLALLISLALPAQALAGMTATACCPMTEAAASVDTAAPAHDCCEDEDDHGTRCASDLSCKCGGHPAIGIRTFAPPLPAVFQAHATAPLRPQSIFPIALWRPPTPPSSLS